MLKGKVAIISGAGQGIGRGIALGLADKGATVVLVDINMQTAEAVANELQSKKQGALAVQADISVSSEVESAVSKVLDEFGRIDILVNNAGLGLLIPTIAMTEEQWEKTVNVNLKGTFFFCQNVGRQMIKQKGGKIINIASVGGHGGIPEMAAYCATKGAIISLTRSIAIEWAEYNIKVNSVSPGMTETSLARNLREQSPEIFKQREKRVPLGRTGQVQDVMSVVVFLAGQESDYITGQDIVVDGGLLAIHPGYVKT